MPLARIPTYHDHLALSRHVSANCALRGLDYGAFDPIIAVMLDKGKCVFLCCPNRRRSFFASSLFNFSTFINHTYDQTGFLLQEAVCHGPREITSKQTVVQRHARCTKASIAVRLSVIRKTPSTPAPEHIEASRTPHNQYDLQILPNAQTKPRAENLTKARHSVAIAESVPPRQQAA